MNLHALCLGFIDFTFVSRHLLGAFKADQVHLFGPEPETGMGRIHGHIATTDDDHLVAYLDLVAQVDFSQEIDAVIDTF